MEFSLKYKTDMYDGIIIDESSLYENPEIFEKELFSLLLQWKEQKKRGIWLKIPKNMSSLIPIAIKLGKLIFCHKLVFNKLNDIYIKYSRSIIY